MSDPREQGPQPPFAEQRQQWPGVESEIQPKPDFGESSYRGHERLKGKAAIITGGDSGIGPAVALAYTRDGADVLISYLSEHSDAEQTVDLVRESGRAGIAVPETLVTRIIAGRLPSARLKSSERSISWLITQPTSRRTKESI